MVSVTYGKSTVFATEVHKIETNNKYFKARAMQERNFEKIESHSTKIVFLEVLNSCSLIHQIGKKRKKL